MRKVVAGLYMSLDGVVEDRSTWGSSYFNKEMLEMIREGTAEADAVLIGRRTYEAFADFWPKQGSDVPMSDFLNNSPKYVLSTTLKTVAWKNSTLHKGDLSEVVAELKARPGKNIQVPGSPRLVRTLMQLGLLDALSLFVIPIVLGKGMRLFEEVTREVPLELVASTSFSTGVVGVTYRPKRNDGAPR